MGQRRDLVSGRAARCPLALLLFACCATAQNLANWNTTTGNWGNANNWDCVVGGISSHCVPGAGFTVININGDINLDVNASVARISGNNGSLTLNGKTLTTTDVLGIQMTSGTFVATGSSVINSSFLLAQNLQLQTSTVNGNVQAFNATITNSTLGSLTISNQLTAANSSIGPNSSLTISQPSSISNSTIGGQFNITFGASLTVANGSMINSTQTLIAQGSLAIQDGSTFTASSAPVFLGLSPGGAAVDVTGTGSALNLTNTALELGQISNSTVTVEHGGSIAASGAGGNFLIGLGVVFPTNSSMTVDSGGTASANNITVSGSAIGSTGVLTVSDSSSSVTARGQLLVDGGVVNAANQGALSVDSLRIPSGSITIDTGATLQVTSGTAVLVGSGGSGVLTLQGGGTAGASGELVLGTKAGSSGAMNINDSFSKWNGAGNVSVGEAGAGSLTVRGGGALVTGSDGSGLSGSIGTQSTGNGIVTLQGGDWTAHGTLQIGAAGTGTLQLLQAGTLESGSAVIGVSGGSKGSVSVGGAGSVWSVGGNLTVGSNGAGTLGIFNAGLVNNANAVIGDKAGSSGVVTVTGLGSLWQNSGILTVGGDGAASLTIDAGTVTAGGASMGSNFSPVQVMITNHGAMNVLGDVSIGGAGSTGLTIQNGGTFDSGVNAAIGGAGGDTLVTVTGPDSSWTLHGNGVLTIDDKGSLLVMDGATVTSNSIFVDSGGLLNGQGGHIIGSVFNNGGTITPGDATGVMSITGNYVQSSGTLLFEIDGLNPAQFDRLVIQGLANITGGSIDIQFGNGFAPAAGESFDLLFANLGLSLTNVSFDVIGLPSGLRFTETVGAQGFALNFASASPSVPEPSSGILLALGLLAMLAAAGWRSFGASDRRSSTKLSTRL